jgi:hypothetical protein
LISRFFICCRYNPFWCIFWWFRFIFVCSVIVPPFPLNLDVLYRTTNFIGSTKNFFNLL